MADPFIGEIRPVGFNFAPMGWAHCSGQLYPISQNTALFSLIGTSFGGDGQSTFALPDLRGRVPISSGQGPGLDSYVLGQVDGAESVALTVNELPPHSHAMPATTSPATAFDPVGQVPATSPRQVYGPIGAGNMAAGAISPSGGGQPHENRQPFLALNYVIALEGIYPSQS